MSFTMTAMRLSSALCALVLGVVEDVLEERRLAGAEVAGQDGDREFITHGAAKRRRKERCDEDPHFVREVGGV